MNFTIAKLKGHKKDQYRKLLSGETIFKAIKLEEIDLMPFEPHHKLDDDSWFFIDGFSKRDFILEILKRDLDSKSFKDIKKKEFTETNCILSVQEDNVYFQKINISTYIKKKIIQFGDIAKVEKGQHVMVVKDIPDAIFFKQEDKLIFRNVAVISSVFKGIDQLYIEATQENIKEFLKEEFLETSDEFNEASVSKPNRKRLGLVMDTMKKMPVEQKDDLVSYISNYCGNKVEVSSDGNKFVLSNDQQLKFILYGIEERFYTTKYGKEKRLANSVRALPF